MEDGATIGTVTFLVVFSLKGLFRTGSSVMEPRYFYYCGPIILT